MCLVALLVGCMERVAHVDVEVWEHIGDYIIGLSMLLCGLYFIVRERDYLQENVDGSISLKTCSCHGHGQSHEHGHPQEKGDQVLVPEVPLPSYAHDVAASTHRSSRRPGRRGVRISAAFDQCQDACCNPVAEQTHVEDSLEADDALAEQVPLLPQSASKVDPVMADKASANIQGALLGVLQGMCCPMGLVGIAFLTSLPPMGIAVFIITFLLVSAVGTGAVACLWLQFASSSVFGSSISSRTLYRLSCGFTVLLGAVWILANFYGMLDKLNYAEGGAIEAAPGLGPHKVDIPW